MDRFTEVQALFEAQQVRGAFPGGQLVVMQAGRVLCDVACGAARGFRGEEPAVAVTSDTRFQVMSASKPFVAFAVALLESEGRVDVSAPVAHYFPEFARNGKAEITLEDVLLHRSGVLLGELADKTELWQNWDDVVQAMADARPQYRRGTLAYSPAGFGWILAEVVRRVTGTSLQDFLLAKLTAELDGIRFQDAAQASTIATSYWLGAPVFMLAGHNIAADFERINNELTCRTACVPGAGLLANARELAAFYDLLLAGGRGLLSPAVLAKYITKQTSGLERQLKIPLALGRGFGLGSFGPHAYGWWNTSRCFGHAGGFGVVAFGDPRTNTAVAIVTNGHRGVADMIRRFAPLGSRIRSAVRAAIHAA